MEYELINGDTKAIASLEGGWLLSLADENGDVLYPRRMLTAADGAEKARGGLHACLPNFGPGGHSGQPQHGYGREMNWELTDQTESSILMKLASGRDGYEAMSAELSYQLGEHVLVTILELTNAGKEALRVAPAFHPYFATGGGEVKLDGEPQPLEALSEAQMFTGEKHDLQLGARTLKCESEGLPVWAKWTDRLGDYVCVEPSVGGFTFVNEDPSDEETLQPGETKAYVFKLAW